MEQSQFQIIKELIINYDIYDYFNFSLSKINHCSSSLIVIWGGSETSEKLKDKIVKYFLLLLIIISSLISCLPEIKRHN